jgi:guanylate kinase
MIFVITSDSESLKNRLIKRNTESDEEIQQRLDIAREELKYQKYYDCIIVNNDYNEALLNLKYVLTRQKESR